MYANKFIPLEMTMSSVGGNYPGHENLLVMQNAKNYNAHLNGLIKTAGLGSRHVLDFGAGVGALAEPASEWAERLTCVELDSLQQAILREKGFNTMPSLEGIHAESVDFVYCVNVLEHIDDDASLLRELHSKISKGGTLFLYVPALQFLFSQMDVAVGHCRRYGKSEVCNLLISTGYEIHAVRYVDFLGVFATLAYKLVGARNGSVNPNALRAYDTFMFPLSRHLDQFFHTLVGKNLLVIAKKNG